MDRPKPVDTNSSGRNDGPKPPRRKPPRLASRDQDLGSTRRMPGRSKSGDLGRPTRRRSLSRRELGAGIPTTGAITTAVSTSTSTPRPLPNRTRSNDLDDSVPSMMLGGPTRFQPTKRGMKMAARRSQSFASHATGSAATATNANDAAAAAATTSSPTSRTRTRARSRRGRDRSFRTTTASSCLPQSQSHEHPSAKRPFLRHSRSFSSSRVASLDNLQPKACHGSFVATAAAANSTTTTPPRRSTSFTTRDHGGRSTTTTTTTTASTSTTTSPILQKRPPPQKRASISTTTTTTTNSSSNHPFSSVSKFELPSCLDHYSSSPPSPPPDKGDIQSVQDPVHDDDEDHTELLLAGLADDRASFVGSASPSSSAIPLTSSKRHVFDDHDSDDHSMDSQQEESAQRSSGLLSLASSLVSSFHASTMWLTAANYLMDDGDDDDDDDGDDFDETDFQRKEHFQDEPPLERTPQKPHGFRSLLPQYHHHEEEQVDFFSQADKYRVDQSVNLMDPHDAAAAAAATGTTGRNHRFVDIVLGVSSRRPGWMTDESATSRASRRGWFWNRHPHAPRHARRRQPWSNDGCCRRAIQQMVSGDGCFAKPRCLLLSLLVLLGVGLGIGMVVVVLAGMPSDASADVDSDLHDPLLSISSADMQQRAIYLQSLLIEHGVATVSQANLLRHEDPNANELTKAFHWMLEEDPAQLIFVGEGDGLDDVPSATTLIQRFILAAFYFVTHADEWQHRTPLGRRLGTADEEEEAAAATSTWYHEEQWMTGKSICEWYGVECESIVVEQDDSRGDLQRNQAVPVVTHLNLTSNNLHGGWIPLSLGRLSHLRLLDLSSNYFTGSLADELFSFGRFEALEYLLMHNNTFVGPLPESLGSTAFSNMKELSLFSNGLIGTIPEFWPRHLANLEVLYLAHNHLSGSLPKDLSGMDQLSYFHAHGNRLTGTLDPVVELRNLKDLRLSHNRFEGKISEKVANLSLLRRLYLGNNQLEGPIPEIFDNLIELNVLELQQNNFRSALPRSFGFLTNLHQLAMEGCGMTGSIPVEWTLMTGLTSLHVQDNSLVGPIPPSLGQLTGLQEFWAQHNFLQSTIPKEISRIKNLKQLYLESNALTGQVPSDLVSLESLEGLLLTETMLTGTIPHSLCSLLKHHHLQALEADCVEEVQCSCCTKCL